MGGDQLGAGVVKAELRLLFFWFFFCDGLVQTRGELYTVFI